MDGSGNLGVSSINASKVTTGTLGAGVVYAGSIQANQIAAGTLLAEVIYAGTIYPSQIGSGTFPAGVIYAGMILVGQIGSGTLPVGVIYAGTVNCSQIGSGTLPVGVVYAGTLEVDNITGWNGASINVGSSGLTFTSGNVIISGTRQFQISNGPSDACFIQAATLGQRSIYATGQIYSETGFGAGGRVGATTTISFPKTSGSITVKGGLIVSVT